MRERSSSLTMSSPPHIGFQAVILCGPGTSLHPFTGAVDLPKALLPIANKPMLHYPLEWCEKACFDSILILTLVEHLIPIQSFIHSRSSPIDIQVEAPSSLDDNLGTADVLRLAYRAGWMAGDFVVLPCDLVTDLEAQEVAKMWMVDQAGFDADMGKRGRRNTTAREDDGGRRGGFGVWYETKGVEGSVKWQETDFLVVDPKAQTVLGFPSQSSGSFNTLLFNLPGQDPKSDSPIPLRRSLLRKHTNLQLLSTRRDSGIYFFPFWVLKFIDRNPGINSIREDLLPWWCKCRWQNKRLAERLGIIDILTGSGGTAVDNRCDVGDMSTTRRRDFKKWTIEDEYEEPPQYSAERLEEIAKLKRGIVVFPIRVPEPKSDTSSVIAPPTEVTIPSITAYFPTISSTFIRRVDTIQLYLFTSLYLASPSVPSSHKIHPSASIDPKAIVSRMDCLIAAKVTIAEKAIVKRCVLGYGVTIAKGAKLLGCVLMDGASVAEGVTLEGCVVGRHAVVGVGAKLKDCQVAEGFFVEEDIQARNECFVVFTGLDDTELGCDGAYDGENNMKDEANQKKTACFEEHSLMSTNRETTALENQKVESIEAVKRTKETDDDQDFNDCVNEMKRKLEKVDNILEGNCSPAASNAEEIDPESDSESERATTIEKDTVVKGDIVVEKDTTAEANTIIKEASIISDIVSENTPTAPTSMVRWWLERVVLVWVVPVIGFGIWYGAVMVFGKHKHTI